MGIGLNLGGQVKGGVASIIGGLGISGNYAEGSGQSVTLNEQSGLFAGSDGLQVKVEDKTTLIGGALASTAEPSKNAVTSGTIETKDVALGSSYDVTSVSGGIGTDGKLAIPGHENDNGASSGVVQSTIAAGSLNITDPTAQTQDLASLNREAPKALPVIDKLPDLSLIMKDQSTSIAMYQKAASAVAGMIGDLAEKQMENAHTRRTEALASGDAAALALAEAEIAGWNEGGAYRTALHGLAGAILGSADGLTGIIGGGAGGVTSSLIIPIIAKAIDDQLIAQGLDPKDPKNAYLRNLLNSTFTTAIAGALTAGAGANYATANVDYNYLTHEQTQEQIRKLEACKDDQECKDAIVKEYRDLFYKQQAEYEACRTSDCLEEHYAKIAEAQLHMAADLAKLLALSVDAGDLLMVLQRDINFQKDYEMRSAGIRHCANYPGDNCFVKGMLLAFGATAVYELGTGLIVGQGSKRLPSQRLPSQGMTIRELEQLEIQALKLGSSNIQTRFLNDVTVIDKFTGKVYKGTVDLQPTYDRIASGKTGLSKNDGTEFYNKQGFLPVQPTGYYTEYVVPTPGINGAGPQRIVAGRNGEMYYTPDHYDTFIPVKIP